ncbi:hypothetical protein EX30DRAFT_71409 [Ascodesmis nigricans]|uniref:Uncharacterized protein n=1 Tax=Ascodesmis nigricans TaxID=341454 RepID=A0A4S2MTU1_9PEZI|nr:hypothetical protein EX30DRAFT_71409 [Ascodesmis nigricans]
MEAISTNTEISGCVDCGYTGLRARGLRTRGGAGGWRGYKGATYCGLGARRIIAKRKSLRLCSSHDHRYYYYYDNFKHGDDGDRTEQIRQRHAIDTALGVRSSTNTGDLRVEDLLTRGISLIQVDSEAPTGYTVDLRESSVGVELRTNTKLSQLRELEGNLEV